MAVIILLNSAMHVFRKLFSFGLLQSTILSLIMLSSNYIIIGILAESGKKEKERNAIF